MGIQGLTKLIGDFAERAISEHAIQSYFGRRVAVDASMSMYQFMIALRGTGMDLTNESGEITSHISGMFYRTIRLLEKGIKPAFVFDGKPPEMKIHELKKRKEKLTDATAKQAEAAESGTAEDAIKFSKRTVRVSKEHSQECQTLLRLMGMPVIEAPSEAEAQCAALAKSGKVWAVGSEDMDTLTFGAPILLRNLTASESQKKEILEINLAAVLDGMGLNQSQFIDLCILCGCDYCPSIRGIGPKTAYNLIKEHGKLEEVLPILEAKKGKDGEPKHHIPPDFDYQSVRLLFSEPDVLDSEQVELKWGQPDVEGLTRFLVEEKKFSEDRVRSGIERLRKATQEKHVQQRLDSFFSAAGSSSSSAGGKRTAGSGAGGKRQKTEPAGRGRGAGGRGRGRGK